MKKKVRFLLIFSFLLGMLAAPAPSLLSEAAASPVRLEVLNPVAEAKTPAAMTARPRPADLAGKRIGILSNSKAGADYLQPVYEKAIKDRFPTAKLRSWRLPYIFIDLAVNRPTLKQAAENSDVVMVLVGD